MATISREEGEGESRTTRLQSFFSSVFSSIFQRNHDQEHQILMDSESQEPIPKPNREEEIQKGKAMNAAVGRRVLGDIGNFVTTRAVNADNEQIPHVPRPTNNIVKKQKAAVKPKNEVVIEISPDTDEVTKQRMSSRRRSGKKVHTMSALLSARSKVASGITDKLQKPIHDIDALDAGDQLAVVEYIEDIYTYYKLSENLSSPRDYMDYQVEINTKMRAILADWLIEVHGKFELMPESLYLTFNIVDRYLSFKKVFRRDLQLIGISAMLIACKYEEIWAPEVNDFICISDKTYTREKILAMEKDILDVLEWTLTVPTPYVFLVRFLKAAEADKEMEHMVHFLAELGLMQYSVIKYSPSKFAASAVYAARLTLKKNPIWTDTLEQHTGFSDVQLMDCVKLVVKCHACAPYDKLKYVFKKYMSKQFDAVALRSPALLLLDE